jgi:ABC-type nitrate/sulfonate/bicarbonate transport system permease component
LLDVADGSQYRRGRAGYLQITSASRSLLKLADQDLFKVLLPATLPYMFTGFRLSLGIAWLIVAAEMLQGSQV